jgi:hypothetical protein
MSREEGEGEAPGVRLPRGAAAGSKSRLCWDAHITGSITGLKEGTQAGRARSCSDPAHLIYACLQLSSSPVEQDSQPLKGWVRMEFDDPNQCGVKILLQLLGDPACLQKQLGSACQCWFGRRQAQCTELGEG